MDKSQYKEMVGELINEKVLLKEQLHKAKEEIKKLETELYFCRRNSKIKEITQ